MTVFLRVSNDIRRSCVCVVLAVTPQPPTVGSTSQLPQVIPKRTNLPSFMRGRGRGRGGFPGARGRGGGFRGRGGFRGAPYRGGYNPRGRGRGRGFAPF